MTRRRCAKVLGLVGVLGLSAVVVGGVSLTLWRGGGPAGRGPGPAASATGGDGAAAGLSEHSPLSELAARLREADSMALAAVARRVATEAEPEGLPQALAEDEAADWIAVLDGLRAGFHRFSSYGKASALTVASWVLERLAVMPAPLSWVDALQPAHDLLTSALTDPSPEIRVAALRVMASCWDWVPGRDLYTAERDRLGAWKESLHSLVVRRLDDETIATRIAAIACLGALDLDAAAAPAVAFLDDFSHRHSAEVRKQVLSAFADRPVLLSDEAVLRRLSDPVPSVAEVAELVLRGRGRTREQITLGRLIVHDRPEVRVSVIAKLDAREDIDPVVWLLHLSRDPDETVRLEAVRALAEQTAPEARQRLEEMAAIDPSETVRQAAVAVAPPDPDATAALPPLPGTPSLNPRAN